MRSKWIVAAGRLAFAALAWLATAAMAQAPAPDAKPPPTGAAAASAAAPASGAPGAVCLKCHEDEVGGMLSTKHAVTGHGRTPWGTGKACQSCHGESLEHIRNTKLPTTTTFKKTTPAAERIAPCIACHQGGERMHWAGSAHDRNDIACNDCHKLHKAVDPVRVAQTQPGVCFDCHKDKRAASLRASTHPIRSGGMPCTSCHQPHGAVGEFNLIKTSVNDTCYTCHADKRGPFLWEHPPAREDCSNCHDPHGTNTSPMLTTRPPFLCQQCHQTPFHPSTLYSGNNLPPNPGADKMLGNQCLNCHVKVHGSNHPAGARFTR
ncbi:MAG TPA: DmsE family decaheme c-type cytochrome [Casimicrobiaceae bacterium]